MLFTQTSEKTLQNNQKASREILHRFAQCIDLHQSQEYANAMKELRWNVTGEPGSFIYIRPLGPLQIIKIQRPIEMNWNELKKIQSKKVTILTHLDPSSLQTNIPSSFKPTKSNVGHTCTAVFDLANSLNTLEKKFSEEARRNIKKGLNSGAIFEITPFSDLSQKQVEEVRELQLNWKSTRPHRETHSRTFEDAMFEQHKKFSSGWLATAKINSKLVAFIWYLETKDIGIYFLACSAPEANKARIPSVLIWKTLEFAKKRGKKFYDFYGMYDARFPEVYEHWKGFSEFKSRFHPEFIEYPAPVRKYL